jgi:hypothetical protein
MTSLQDAWQARRRARWMRPNAHLFMRPDAHRYLKPDWKTHVLPDCEPLVAALLEGKANFNPSQPRVPKGEPEGGQWTDAGGSGGSDAGSGGINDPRVLSDAHPDNDWQPGARYASKEPKPPGPGHNGGPPLDDPPKYPPKKTAVGRRSTIAAEIGLRLINAYRSGNILRDLFGERPGTVAVATIEGEHIFGVSSNLPSYSREDRAEADSLRDRYWAAEHSIPRPGAIGQMPSNAFYHAETTILLRAARRNGGTLSGRSIEIVSDRPMCNNCDTVLPFVGRELGNPTVTFIGRNGSMKTMKDGKWFDGSAE